MPEPAFPKLLEKFNKVSKWESVCVYLLDDDDGTCMLPSSSSNR